MAEEVLERILLGSHAEEELTRAERKVTPENLRKKQTEVWFAYG
jgi:hypothetical protein